jgi:hypothetical protein
LNLIAEWSVELFKELKSLDLGTDCSLSVSSFYSINSIKVGIFGLVLGFLSGFK